MTFDFLAQAAVPKHAKLQVNSPSSTTVPANNSGAVTQVFRISNPMRKFFVFVYMQIGAMCESKYVYFVGIYMRVLC